MENKEHKINQLSKVKQKYIHELLNTLDKYKKDVSDYKINDIEKKIDLKLHLYGSYIIEPYNNPFFEILLKDLKNKEDSKFTNLKTLILEEMPYVGFVYINNTLFDLTEYEFEHFGLIDLLYNLDVIEIKNIKNNLLSDTEFTKSFIQRCLNGRMNLDHKYTQFILNDHFTLNIILCRILNKIVCLFDHKLKKVKGILYPDDYIGGKL